MDRRRRCGDMLGTACPWLEEVGKVGHPKGIEVGLVVSDGPLPRMRSVS